MTVTFEDIKKAAERIRPYVKRTPILTSQTLNNITGAELYFKCENFQKAGAFKFRGATNAVFSLIEEQASHGVATHSSGNHAGALALAAKTRGIKAHIVMPKNSAEVKKQAVKGYDAEITFSEPGMEAREATLNEVIKKTGATLIHPFDNENVIAGQGTVAIELLEQHPDLDVIIVPIGGGGLISGISIAAQALSKKINIIGAEPELANDTYLSFKEKKRISIPSQTSICDGLLMTVGQITFPIILENVTDIFTASEQSVLQAIQLILERMKIVVEPSAAITLAIMLENPTIFRGKKIGLILSGGNIDIKAIAKLL